MRSMRTILAAGLVTLALPGAALAADPVSTTNEVTGAVGSELTITAPGDFSLDSITHAGPNTDASALTLTTTNPSGVSITATDDSELASDGHLLVGGTSLFNALSFNLGGTVGTLAGETGVSRSYGAAGTHNVSLSISQTVDATDSIAFGDAVTAMQITYSASENAN